ncbi:hypothetical protein [Salibaculum sp.]|uniref:hypothetical protein n=1 Tax=Salibaculum sp. TaxID=2855480 RepID=UPI002B489820|nr:hypothetical protein [Salibaculum sp.]HKL69511.1 hypothetical protein [Salibaculum sp.]
MQIIRLVPREAGQHDQCLPVAGEMAGAQDVRRTEDFLSVCLTDLGRHLRRLEDDYQLAEPERLDSRLHAIVALADRIGMRRVARVGADAHYCHVAGDEPALAATLARLMRLLTATLDEIGLIRPGW